MTVEEMSIEELNEFEEETLNGCFGMNDGWLGRIDDDEADL